MLPRNGHDLGYIGHGLANIWTTFFVLERRPVDILNGTLSDPTPAISDKCHRPVDTQSAGAFSKIVLDLQREVLLPFPQQTVFSESCSRKMEYDF